jgi:peptidoglycan-associated lipoprotein
MNSNIKITLSFLLFLFTTNLIAQPLRVVKYETKLEVADESAKAGDYYGAIEWYTKAYEESKDLNLQIAIADLYVIARDFPKAEKIYDRILKRDKEKEFEEVRLDYARVMKGQGKYKEALKEFNTVIADPEADDSLKNVAKFELSGIELMEKMAPNLEAVVSPIAGKINSASAESAPVQSQDGSLYFSSYNRKKEVILDGKEGSFEAKLYTAQKNDKGEYDKVEALPENINRPGFNSGGVSFSKDGRRMYFTRATLSNNKVEKSVLFVSTKGAEGWGAAREVVELKGDFNVKHPIMGDLFGGEVLFFTSNMVGGKGGYDLYYCPMSGGEVGKPINLGSVVNTAKDEITPYYNNGTLYFSSTGHAGIGGFDIFYATWTGSAWQEVTNIGFNYNSAFDDMFLRFNDSGSSGFLVSNRPSKTKAKIKGSDMCCDDIFSVYIRELVVDLLVTVEDDKGPLKGAGTELYDLTIGGYPDTKTNVNTNTFNHPLEIDRDYKVIVAKEGYFPDTFSFNTNGILDDYTVKKTVKLRKDPNYDPNKNNNPNDGGDVVIIKKNEAIRLNNIYYDYDKYNILPDAEQDLSILQGLMEDYPDMVIELSSHTDARGNDAYNQSLSLNRAKSAREWLVEQGINASRIKAVGYGEKQILNRCKNDVRCSEEEHRLNRRTEFKLIGGPSSIEINSKSFENRGGNRSTELQKTPTSGKQSFGTKIDLQKKAPIITFVKPKLDLGKIVRGEKKEVIFEFTNTGLSDLIIEIATTCKCTDITWPTEPVKPGQKGSIKGIYDTKNEVPGRSKKTIDIYSNTDPIVVEAKFEATIVEQD